MFPDLLLFLNSFYVYCDNCLLCDPSNGNDSTVLLYTCTYRHHKTGLGNDNILLIVFVSVALWSHGVLVVLSLFRSDFRASDHVYSCRVIPLPS